MVVVVPRLRGLAWSPVYVGVARLVEGGGDGLAEVGRWPLGPSTGLVTRGSRGGSRCIRESVQRGQWLYQGSTSELPHN